jgi:hypothetical protein
MFYQPFPHMFYHKFISKLFIKTNLHFLLFSIIIPYLNHLNHVTFIVYYSIAY